MKQIITFCLTCTLLLLGCIGCKKDSVEVTTIEVKSTKATSATLYARMEKKLISRVETRGFCLSTSPAPSVESDMVSQDEAKEGDFSLEVDQLTNATTYYVRAYCKLKNGKVVYGNEISFTTNSYYAIGETGPGNGIVFYNAGTSGWTCLEAVVISNPVSTAMWGCGGTSIPNAVGGDLGTGDFNSSEIVKVCVSAGTAADLALKLNNGKDDWYLPNSSELSKIYQYYKSTNNYFGNYKYWSSSQINSSEAVAIDFANGNFMEVQKSTAYRVIAIRKI